jgi:hypothetical protein
MNVRIIIPKWSKAYLAQIATIAGGFTSWQGTGGWNDSKGNLIVEPVTIVDIDTDTEKIDSLRAIARQVAIDQVQECVFFSINGVVEYVKP